MNAPEKIYYNPSFQDYWKEERESVEDVEYIRKDIVDDMLKTAEDHAYFAGKEKLREELQEWAKEERKKCESKDSELWQRLNTLTDVIVTIKKI